MKYVLLVLAGGADRPCKALAGSTPLAAARCPALDRLARAGRIGRVAVAEPGAAAVRSERVLLGLLGADPARPWPRRGPLELAGAGGAAAPQDLVFAGRLVSLSDERIADLTGGRISTREAELLLGDLGTALADDGLVLLPLGGHRFALIAKDAARADVETEPPAAGLARAVGEIGPRGADALRYQRFLEVARGLLADHDVNKVRVDLGENPANFAWLFGAGARAPLPPFESACGLAAAAVARAPLARGVARELALELFDPVESAQAGPDAELATAADLAIRALRARDFVFVHLQAASDATHARDPRRKVEALERADAQVVAPLAAALCAEPAWRLLVACDHVSPSEAEGVSADPAPFLLAGSDVAALREYPFDEAHAAKSDLQVDDCGALLEYYLGRARRAGA